MNITNLMKDKEFVDLQNFYKKHENKQFMVGTITFFTTAIVAPIIMNHASFPGVLNFVITCFLTLCMPLFVLDSRSKMQKENPQFQDRSQKLVKLLSNPASSKIIFSKIKSYIDQMKKESDEENNVGSEIPKLLDEVSQGKISLEMYCYFFSFLNQAMSKESPSEHIESFLQNIENDKPEKQSKNEKAKAENLEQYF